MFSSKVIRIINTTSLIERVLQGALAENPLLCDIDQEKMRQVIVNGLQEILQLDELAWYYKRSKIPLTNEAASRIKAVIIISGPGTWYEPHKEDRYKDKQWAAWMDRRRLLHGAWIVRRIAEINSSTYFRGSLDTLNDRIGMVKESIINHGPYFIYTGREDERDAVKRVLAEKDVIIPPEKVYIIEGAIDNTVDQVKTLKIPPEISINSGDRIAIVAHSPQMVRLGHIIQKYKPFPSGIELQPLPLPIPSGGFPEYPEQELRGLLYYTFITGDASEEPYPYILK